jgi:hypothetical protein
MSSFKGKSPVDLALHAKTMAAVEQLARLKDEEQRYVSGVQLERRGCPSVQESVAYTHERQNHQAKDLRLLLMRLTQSVANSWMQEGYHLNADLGSVGSPDTPSGLGRKLGFLSDKTRGDSSSPSSRARFMEGDSSEFLAMQLIQARILRLLSLRIARIPSTGF